MALVDMEGNWWKGGMTRTCHDVKSARAFVGGKRVVLTELVLRERKRSCTEFMSDMNEFVFHL